MLWDGVISERRISLGRGFGGLEGPLLGAVENLGDLDVV